MIVGPNKIVVAFDDVWIICSETQDVIVIKRFNHVAVRCAARVFIYVQSKTISELWVLLWVQYYSL